jgi:hypothetical protein
MSFVRLPLLPPPSFSSGAHFLTSSRPGESSSKSDSNAGPAQRRPRLQPFVPNCGGMSPDDIVEIKMIDFAHTLPSAHRCSDAGYLHGLVSLIKHLKEVETLIDTVDSGIVMMKVLEIYHRSSRRNVEKAKSLERNH